MHYVTYFRYQQSDPKATNKTMPSHHQSAEQWLTQLTRMRNCTPTKRPHQAEGDQFIGTYKQEEQQKKQPRISSQSTHAVQPYNLVSLTQFNEGTQQLTSTQRTKLQQAKPNPPLQQPSDAGIAESTMATSHNRPTVDWSPNNTISTGFLAAPPGQRRYNEYGPMHFPKKSRI